MKKIENRWSQGILMVCTACHKKTLGGVDLKLEGNAGENLKTFLKGQMIQLGHGKTIRVVTSSCLDVCEQKSQAAVYCDLKGETETFILHPEQEQESLLELLKEKLAGGQRE